MSTVVTVTLKESSVVADCGVAEVTVTPVVLELTAGERGIQGKIGIQGDDGRSIVSIIRTAGDGSPGTTDTYTITYDSAPLTSTFDVYNGADGGGLVVVVHDGTLSGTGLTGDPLTTTGDMTLNNFNEDSEELVFTAGAATLPVGTCKNKQFMTLTQEGFITTSGTPVVGKPILLTITHSGSAWPLNWNGTALTILVGAVGETERVLVQWDGTAWDFDSIGLFDQVI